MFQFPSFLKSIMEVVELVKMLEEGSRPVTLLDGDIVRTHLSSELGFSKEHRSINIQRIGFVASEITKNGGVAICAPIAPYQADRRVNRELISPLGGYIEIYVNTPMEKCEERDVKGLYELARKGVIKEFTGISDPYEEPVDSEIIIDLDPNYSNGGGYFMLGAVHFKSPYIPFILSWPSNDEALNFLTKAHETGKATPTQTVYLARSFYKDKQKEKAIQLLTVLISQPLSDDEPVEDFEKHHEAKGYLADWN